MSRFVLDNTVTMARCLNDEATPFTETLLGRLAGLTDSAIVPALGATMTSASGKLRELGFKLLRDSGNGSLLNETTTFCSPVHERLTLGSRQS